MDIQTIRPKHGYSLRYVLLHCILAEWNYNLVTWERRNRGPQTSVLAYYGMLVPVPANNVVYEVYQIQSRDQISS